MGREDWYRRTTWSNDDREQFFARLERSREAFHKSQYLRIQAYYLQLAGLYEDALQLLNLLVERFGLTTDPTSVLLQKAECLWALDAKVASFDAFVEALSSQRKHPHAICFVALPFAERFCDYDDGAFRRLLVEELQADITRSSFGTTQMKVRTCTIMVRLLVGLGEVDEANRWRRLGNSAQEQLTLDAMPVVTKRAAPDGSARGRKSDLVLELDKIQRRIGVDLKSHGFRVGGRSFNKTLNGLTQVVTVQMGPYDPPSSGPSLSPRLYGKFTVNLGIHVPAVHKWAATGGSRAFLREYDCELRVRLGELGPSPSDRWWHVVCDTDTVEDLRSRLASFALPFFDRYADEDAILRECATADYDGMGDFSTPARIVCALIRYERGELDECRLLLGEQAGSTPHPGHRDYVQRLATRMGLGPLRH